MSSPFRKMRGIPDRTLNEALIDHRDVIGRLVKSALAQNRWNVGMVLAIVLTDLWLTLLTFAPRYIGVMPTVIAAFVSLVVLGRLRTVYRRRRAIQEANKNAD